MKNGLVNMRYSFGKTHAFQMELQLSMSFSCFLTIPELDAFGPRGVAKIGPGRFAWAFLKKSYPPNVGYSFGKTHTFQSEL